jgi:Holliday junction resolvase RusA-like endonuclease
MTAKDHKRKARPIAPATVTVEPGCITVVVPDVLGKNESHRRAGTIMHTSGATKRYRESVNAGALAYFDKVFNSETQSSYRLWADDGAWRLEVLGVWPTENHQVGFVAPRGDADAAIPQALDALQHAGVLDDDARVVEVRAWNLYRKGVRATVMRLVRVDVVGGDQVEERNVAVAHLLPLVPQSPEPPAKPARKRKVKP